MMFLFVDGSATPKLKIGYGSYLLIPDDDVENLAEEFIRKKIRLKKFHSTTSTKLEVETLLWALRETEKTIKDELKNEVITICSDSQNIIGLPNRKIRLESRNFKTKRGGKHLNNADLYKEIYEMLGRLECRFIKLSGHSKIKDKNKVEKIFTYVDRSSRRALREDLKTNKA